MRYARMEGDRVAEIVELPDGLDIEDCFHPDLRFEPVTAEVQPGWIRGSDGSFSSGVDEVIDLDAFKTSLRGMIDVEAERQRLRYITPGAGQAMTYAQKAEEARLCLNATAPEPEDYPLLAAEIGITASTLAGVAQVVALANAQWLQIGAAIEAGRLSAKKAVSEAETVEAAQAAADAVVWP